MRRRNTRVLRAGLQPYDAQGVAEWAKRVTAHLRGAASSIIAAGRELVAAKAALKHGEWERMFSGHAEAVKDPVPFGARTARMLIAIAEHPDLTNRKHVSVLPPSWGTLYELTKVPEPMLRAALTDGRVHPAMERREVAALRPRPTPVLTVVPSPKLGARTPGSELYHDVHARISSVFFDLPTEERRYLVDALRQFLDHLESDIEQETERV